VSALLLLALVARVVAVVTVLCLGVGYLVVGADRLRALPGRLRARATDCRREAAALVVVLLFSAVGRERLGLVAEVYGVNLTGAIFAVEGGFVPWLQTFATPIATRLLSWTYVYGYAFLLVFPVLAYATLDDATTLRRLLAAYAINYVVGVAIYALVVAYGPRNVMPDLVSSLLFATQPELEALTTRINENTNVFPSLHASLSVTAGTFGYLTRREYPRWAALSGLLAAAVVLATMYLGIHWASDVVAGILLAAVAVRGAVEWIEPDAAAETKPGTEPDPEADAKSDRGPSSVPAAGSDASGRGDDQPGR